MEERGKANEWLDPSGFSLITCLDEHSEPIRWRIVAQDLVLSRPVPELSGVASECTPYSALFPPLQTVLAAGVVQSCGPGAAVAPRSVVLTASTTAPSDTGIPDTVDPIGCRDNNSYEGGRSSIHIWAVDVRPCLPTYVHASTVPPSDTRVASDSMGKQITVTLDEIATMTLPKNLSPSSSSGCSAIVQQQGIGRGRANGCGANWRCCLAQTGAWAAIQLSEARILLVGFGAALESPGPHPPFPDSEPGGVNFVAAAGGGQDGHLMRAAQRQQDNNRLASEERNLRRLHCLDLDLAAAMAAAVGPSENLAVNSCQALSCCESAGRIVLDVAVSSNVGMMVNDGNDDGSSAIGRSDAVGDSVLLRIVSRLRAAAGSLSRREGEAQLTGGESAAVASAQLSGQICTCCPLPRLAEAGFKFPGSSCLPTRAAGTALKLEALAELGPPALVGSNNGQLHLVAPCMSAAAFPEPLHRHRGTLKVPEAAELPPGGMQTKGQQEPALALAAVTQLRLPGAADCIHLLPRVHMGAAGRCSSQGGRAGNTKGGINVQADADGAPRGYGQPAQQHRPNFSVQGQDTYAVAKSAFAAVLCRDAARSMTVLRVLRQWHQPKDTESVEIRPAPSEWQEATVQVPAVSSGRTSTVWSLQQLLVVPAIQDVLPVPLPSALSLALAMPPVSSGQGRGADETGGDLPGGSGDRGAGVGEGCGGAVLVSPAAVLVLGWTEEEREGQQHRGGGGRSIGFGHDGRWYDGDVRMQDVDEDVEMADKEGWRSEFDADSDADLGDTYTQVPFVHRPQDCKPEQQQRQRRHNVEGEEEREGGGGGGSGLLAAWGPVSMRPWRRALVLPSEVQPLPPQALLQSWRSSSPAAAATSTTATATATVTAPPFAAGAVTGVLRVDPGRDTSQTVEHQHQHQQQQRVTREEDKEPAGFGGETGRGGSEPNAQEAGMAKVLAHMSRRWDAGVQHNLEQRAALGRMVELTRQVEQLIADVGQQPQLTHGSAGARPPYTLGLLDPFLELEKELRLQQRGDGDLQASGECVQTKANAGCGEGDGAGKVTPTAVHRFLEQLFGDGGELSEGGHSNPERVAAFAAHREGEPTPNAINWRSSKGAKAGGSIGRVAFEPRAPIDTSWSPVLESLTQSRQGGNWVLQSVIRLDAAPGSECKSEKCGKMDVEGENEASRNGGGGGSGCGGGSRPPLGSGGPLPMLTSSALPVQLDDVALLLYSSAGLPMTGMRGRWTVVDRGWRRVAVEAAAPLGDLLSLATAAATAARGGRNPGFGAGDEPNPESCQLQQDLLQIALGPLPGLFEPTIDDTDLDLSTSSSNEDSDFEAVRNFDRKLNGENRSGGGRSTSRRRSSHGYWVPELELGAVVRITVRTSGTGTLQHLSDHPVSSHSLGHSGEIQVRVLDLGRVLVPLDVLLLPSAEGSLPHHRQAPQQQKDGRDDVDKADAGMYLERLGSGSAAMSLLLAPSRSLLVVAISNLEEEEEASWAKPETGPVPLALAGGCREMKPCPNNPQGVGGPQQDSTWAGSGMCSGLQERLLSTRGFHSPEAHEWTGAPKPETGNIEDLTGAQQLIWEGPLGWRCIVSLKPYGVFGCEVELSYVDCADGGGSGGAGAGCDGLSGAALDQVQWHVKEAAKCLCEQEGRRLSVLCPNPLASSQLESMDMAAGALQRCIDATLELLEQALLSQQQQQQQQAGKAKLGPKPALKDCAAGGDETEAAITVSSSGTYLQAMLQDVLKLQLQLSTAMENYLVS